MLAKDLLYPDPARPQQTAETLCHFFSELPFVYQVVVFGSLAQGSSDRWSDIDLLVVTQGKADYQALLESLREYKPVLYHAPIRQSVEHPGRHALGIVFKDESIFHNLDLNFMSLSEYNCVGALDWFGPKVDYYIGSAWEKQVTSEYPARGSTPAGDFEIAPSTDELRIDSACYWTKRALRRVLRTKQGLGELEKRCVELKEVMHSFPDSCLTPGRNICQLARTYITIAEYVLDTYSSTNVEGLDS